MESGKAMKINLAREPVAKPPRRKRGRKAALALLALVLILLLAGAANGRLFNRKAKDSGQALTYAVARGDLTIAVTESGSLQAQRSVSIQSEIMGMATIITIVPEGTYVQKGELLVELDSSELTQRLNEQKISFERAQGDSTQAKASLEIQKSESESRVAAAELDLAQAQDEEKRYLEGDGPQETRQALAERTLALEKLQRAKDKLQWTQKLYEKGYLTESELKGDELSVKEAEINVTGFTEKVRIIEQYKFPMETRRLRAKVEEAKRKLDRAKAEAAASLAKSEADLRAKDATLQVQKRNLEKYENQVAKTKITAPQPGLVVYGGRERYWGQDNPIQAGTKVHERQTIITLPDTAAMMVEAKVHETAIDRVKAGQETNITIDAFPDRRYKGKVTKVAVMPDGQSRWMNPDLKIYPTEVSLDGEVSDLKPGMSAKVEIIVAELKNVLYAPVQAVSVVEGKEHCYVVTPTGNEKRAVTVGLSNESFVEIKSGLKQGEKVMLYAPVLPGEKKSVKPAEDKKDKQDAAGPPVPPPSPPPAQERAKSPERRKPAAGGKAGDR
ncbi:MAG: efflux RND transporter periplasmic adaptor subunit [Planctomycetes bacterium]|nr:efflux RND transporter periplasmic adaptor subunit [Planctomycetota bacterium]